MNQTRARLIQIFVTKNNQINLSSIREPNDIMTKHIHDALELNKILQIKNGSKVCDVGTGGGFPLLPLAISNTQARFIGIDSRRKKINAVNDMIKELDLKNVSCERSRIEEYSGDFDYITARAIGYVDKVILRSYNLLKKGGLLILYKQRDKEEKDSLKYICKKYHLTIIKEHTYKLFPEDIHRVIYILKKK